MAPTPVDSGYPTTAVLTQTATLRDLFFGPTPREAADQLATSLKQSGTVRDLTSGVPTLTTVAEHEIAKATDRFLSMNLADLAAAGWKRYEALRQAARRTCSPPATEEIVALATHQIASTHHPTIDVFLDGTSIATIEVTIDVSFKMTGVLAVVRQARLASIRSGHCTVSGRLAVRGITTASRQQSFDLSGAVRLRNGIPLLSADESRASAGHRIGSDA